MHLNTVTTAVRCMSRQMLVLTPPPSLPGLYSVVSDDSLLPKNIKGSREFPDRFRTSREPSDVSTLAIGNTISKADEARTIETVKILIAMLYTIKNHLRAEWGVALSPGTSLTEDGQEATAWEYLDLLPPGLKGYEHRGLGLTLELATFIEKFVEYGVKKYRAFVLRCLA